MGAPCGGGAGAGRGRGGRRGWRPAGPNLITRRRPALHPLPPQNALARLSLGKLNITFRPTFAVGGAEGEGGGEGGGRRGRPTFRSVGPARPARRPRPCSPLSAGNATLWIASNLTATAALGCDPPCGDNGRCAQPPGAAASAACACRCGFTGPACDAEDKGGAACPAWPAWPALAVPAAAAAGGAPARASALPSVPGGDDPVLGSLSPAPAPASLAGVTANGDACTCSSASACPLGWAGANCDACTADDACAASTGDPGATCHKGLAYTSRSVTKAYVCDLSKSPLGALLDDKRGYWINCTTTPVEADIGGGKNATGGTCEVGLRLATDLDNPVICTARACAFAPGSAKVTCPTCTCECPKAADGKCPALVAPYVGAISGKAVTADCSGSDCTLNVQDFPIPLKTPCVPGDCQSERAAELKGGPPPPAQARNYSSLVAALPVLALAATAALAAINLAVATSGGHKKGGGGGAAAAAAAAAGPKAPGRAPAHQLRELKWEDLTCTVPASRWTKGAGGPGHWGAAAAGAVLDAAAAAVAPASRGLAHCQSTAAALLADRTRAPGGGGRAPTASDASSSSDSGAAPAPAPAPATPARSWFAPAPRVMILRGVSGVAHVGELVGVLGPSGCGKTTMLSILAGSVSSLSASSIVRGSVTLDGARRKAWATRLVAHVPQFDFLLPTLTVAETLRYSALLRLPPTTPAADVHDRVAATLEELGLAHVAGSQVGGASGVRGVSGGERRRVTIGMELVIDPAVIVLDEPTSGLDSHTALNLMTTLKSVASAGRIVLLSFHQPSPAMFDLLDRVFLMARGHVLYSGRPDGAAAWLASAGAPPPANTAVAEHMLAAVSDPRLRDPLLAHVLAGRAADAKLGGGGDVEAGAGGSPLPVPPLALRRGGRAPLAKPARTPFLRELAVLFWRAGTEVVRNPALLLMHAAMGASMGVLCGGIFYGLKFDIAGAQGRLGACFFSLTLMALTSLTTVDLLTNERGLVVKEVLGGYYRPVSYYISKGGGARGRGGGRPAARARLSSRPLVPRPPPSPPLQPPSTAFSCASCPPSSSPPPSTPCRASNPARRTSRSSSPCSPSSRPRWARCRWRSPSASGRRGGRPWS